MPITQSPSPCRDFVIVQPRLAGARDSAKELLAHLPRTGIGEVRLMASNMDAASQSFADELIAQALVCRDTRHLVVSGPSPRFAQHLQESALRRGVAERLDVTPRT